MTAPPLYLDHAATTPLLPAAQVAMLEGFAIWANPSSPHAPGRRARAALEDARGRIRAALGWEGEVILTNEPDAVLLYVQDVTDSTRFPASFISSLSYLLASYLAGPIIKGNDGARLGDSMRQRALSLADVAATASANASSAESLPQPNLLAVRA